MVGLSESELEALADGVVTPNRAAQGFIATIQELIDVGRELIAKEGL